VPTTVFPDINDYLDAVAEGMTFSNLVVPMGDGYEIRGNKNQAFTGADGLGGVTSHKGIARFRVTFGSMPYTNADASKAANKLIAFLRSTLGNYTSFYFYNPKEAPTPDASGSSTTGRYLVRFAESTQDIEWQVVNYHRASFTLIEVRA
jgi:hypothetical protein